MRVSGTTLAFCVLLGSAAGTTGAEAARTKQEPGHAARPAQAVPAKAGLRKAQHAQSPRAHQPGAAQRRARPVTASYGSGISCVPYARSVTGMAITGNGGDWWYNASGRYDRGNRPEPGSVMAFRRSGGMSRGHVAVVSRVLGPREVLIDHANWGGPGIRKGAVMHNVSVVDVSERNDWTAVRVQVGHDRVNYGRTYATYGFIYNRPEDGARTWYAAAQPAPRSLRFQELAEMPVGGAYGAQPVSFRPQGLTPLRKASAQRHR